MLRGVGGGLLLKAPTTEIPSLLGDIDNTICNTHTHLHILRRVWMEAMSLCS